LIEATRHCLLREKRGEKQTEEKRKFTVKKKRVYMGKLAGSKW
jgi:hypothetical protein